MKNFLLITFSLFVIFLTQSCTNKPSSNSLPPLKINIPEELKRNDEIVKFIKASEEAINLYSDTAEELAEDCKSFAGKKEEELNMLDKVKMVAALGKFTSNFAQFASKYNEMEDQTKILEEGLNEEQAVALTTVMEAFKHRMEQLEEKYKNIADQPK